MRAGRKLRRETLSDTRTSEILNAAQTIFALKGFNEATVDEIAAKARLAKGTLYLYFKSKRDLYLKTLQRGGAELLGETRKNMQRARSVREKIRSFIATRVKYAEENPDFYVMYLSETSKLIHPAPINASFRGVHLEQGQVLEQVLRQGMGQGEIRHSTRVDVLAFAIQDTTRSIVVRRLLGQSITNIEDEIDVVFDLIWNGIAR